MNAKDSEKHHVQEEVERVGDGPKNFLQALSSKLHPAVFNSIAVIAVISACALIVVPISALGISLILGGDGSSEAVEVIGVIVITTVNALTAAGAYFLGRKSK